MTNLCFFFLRHRNYFFFISWRLITLQHFSGFCHTLTWISHRFIHSTRYFWIFPVHPPWALVSCIQPGLVICFTLDNIHVSMLFSWNTLAFSHRVQKSVLYICVSFSVLHIGLFYHLSKFHIYVLVYCIGVYLSGLLHCVWWAPVSSISLELIQMNSF